MRIEIRSPLAPDVLMERIRAAIDPESGWSGSGPGEAKRFRGTVIGRSATIRLRRRTLKHAYGPEFMGTVEADPGGSLLRGRIRTEHGMRAMIWFTAIFTGCFAVVFAIMAFIPGTGFGGLKGVGAGIYMAVVMTGAAALGALPQWLWRNRLHEALRRTAEGGDLERP